MPLVALWGPTGVGKSTVIRHLLAAEPGIRLIETFTTRPARRTGWDTKTPSTPLPRNSAGLLVTHFGDHSYFNAIADLQTAAKDPDGAWIVDWVHHHSVDLRQFGPHTNSIVLAASHLRTTYRLIRARRFDRIPAALAQGAQFRREVHPRAITSTELRWRLVTNNRQSPAQTAKAILARATS